MICAVPPRMSMLTYIIVSLLCVLEQPLYLNVCVSEMNCLFCFSLALTECRIYTWCNTVGKRRLIVCESDGSSLGNVHVPLQLFPKKLN